MAAPCSLTLVSPPLLTFTALFSIIDPLSGAFIVFGATRDPRGIEPRNDPPSRRRKVGGF
jgi:hypothetical protein